MTNTKRPLGGNCCRALAHSALLLSVSANAEVENQLEPLVVSALRVPQAASTVTSAVTTLDPQDLESRGITQLRDALNEAPGVIATSTSGQTGAMGNLFIRGTQIKHSQIVIDGMRLSDSNNELGHTFAGARTYDVGNIELVRGPQGAIYGGESIGGVLWLETPRGSGSPHGSSDFEAGSFESFAAHSAFQGKSRGVSYFLSGGYEETDNDAPHNHFHQSNTAMRVEGEIDPVWTLGTTLRAVESTGQDLDSSFSKDGESRNKNTLFTIYAIGKVSDRWTARFHAGYYLEYFNQNYTDTWFGPSNYRTDLQAGSISTDHEITLADNLRLLTGAFFHESSYESTTSAHRNGERYGAHATLEWDIIEHLTTTGSLRWEDYDVYGDKLTWRVGSIYNIASTGTTFRGSIGTSFRTPSYMELYYIWGGNPNLSAESSLGWDLGVKQTFGSHHTVEATWFRNQISNRIDYSSTFTYTNIPESASEGVELALRGSWLDNVLGYRLAWTHLFESLKDQPYNAATASLDWKPTPKSLIGLGATHLSERSWGGARLASYTVARLYGSYQVTDALKLHARLENMFDEHYELGSFAGDTVNGAGVGVYGGLTVDW